MNNSLNISKITSEITFMVRKQISTNSYIHKYPATVRGECCCISVFIISLCTKEGKCPCELYE